MGRQAVGRASLCSAKRGSSVTAPVLRVVADVTVQADVQVKKQISKRPQQSAAFLIDKNRSGGGLPAFDGITFVDFLSFCRNFRRLQRRLQLLNFVTVFIIFT